ncbi:Fic family protein [Nonomuraea sp. NBC_00507]|uniref:Fic family protein n=1 Tax=Nonomuraea sp. NBC_00507 TaxID=2976002 RepID=UPI002E172B5A
MFSPTFTITPSVATALMAIEGDRQAIMELPINVEVLAGLRHTARLAATHYSTQIEGNRLTQAQVAEALHGAHFPGRERDEAEVRNYHRALEYVESLATAEGPIDELQLRRVHGLVQDGKAAPSPYRPGQNVIRDAATGRIVYMPPEAHDVPALMGDLFKWLNRCLSSRELPIPIVAAITHYQYATIHPYYDGNGRTARLLTTLVLHRAGYGLKGIYSLDEHYARNLHAYYAALTVGPSHNCYMGRAEADITGFVNYFCQSMADALGAVRARAADVQDRTPGRDDSALLRRLDPRRRRLLEFFRDRGTATTTEMAAYLSISPRTMSALARKWVDDGFLEIHDPSRKARSYRLSPSYDYLINR